MRSRYRRKMASLSSMLGSLILPSLFLLQWYLTESWLCSLERLVRNSLTANDHDRIRKIVDQLCDDYAYSIHQPYARNGGLIGLAAASIALGTVCRGTLRAAGVSDLCGTECRPLPRENSAARAGMLYRPGCKSQILCLREHVQHCKDLQGRDITVLQ